MLPKIFVLLCAIAAVMAYPYADEAAYSPYEGVVALEAVPYQRVRRQVQLQGGGGGGPGKGFDFSIDGRAPVWTSDNGRHQVDVTGGWGQHLGGPYGNGPADKRIGAGYTFRF